MQVPKIHRAIKFRQEAWMAPYTDMNTKLHAKTTSDFEKDFFKLANNAVFGKIMEKPAETNMSRSSELLAGRPRTKVGC